MLNNNGETLLKRTVWMFVFLVVMAAMPMMLPADVEDAMIVQEMKTGLGANDLGDIVWDGETLWVEGSGSLTKLIGEGHSVNDWISLKNEDGFGRGSISALWASGNVIIVSWVYFDYYEAAGEDVFHGDGITISVDSGTTWNHIPFLDLFPERTDLRTPNRYTTVWDIAVSKGIIWCSTTAGFLLKSTNIGNSWTKLLPGDDEFDFTNPNHHGQCVDAYGDTLWVGTFQGMNLSTDGGLTWENFSWPRDGSGNPNDQWPGNFPVAVEHKVVGGKTHVWVASQDYLGLGVIGICHTDDNGRTWEYKKYLDRTSIPYNITFGHSGATDPAVGDSTVFVATTAGLLVSYDLGETWATMDIRESENLDWDERAGISSVLVAGETLWVTSADGLARSNNWGASWEIFKGVQRVLALDTGNRNIGISSEYDYLNDTIRTYAFPNPFSPSRSDADYSHTKIQYAIEYDARVTVCIYSFSGKLIREIISGEDRSGGRDYQEVWDGKDRNNNIVPNGVYFYVVKTHRGDSALGKIMVLD